MPINKIILAPKSILAIFLNRNKFTPADLSSESLLFTSIHFILHDVEPFASLQTNPSGDNSQRKLRLHFGNWICHISHAIAAAMTRMNCRRILRANYSPDLAICDAYLVDHAKKS
jgi:hypothetical protein